MSDGLDRTGRSGWARWSLALRLARREVRRHPWRHALVVFMIMVPVMASMVAFSAVSTSQAHFERKESLQNYGSDLYIGHMSLFDLMVDAEGSGEPADLGAVDQKLHSMLPAGSEVLTATSSADWFSTAGERADGAGPVLVGVQTTSAPTPELFDVESGNRPDGEAEVFLTRTLADLGGWSVGDTIESGRDERSFTVTGIGYARDETTLDVAVLGDVPESYWTSVPAGYDEVVLGVLSSVDDGDGGYLYSRGLLPRHDRFAWLPDGTDPLAAAERLRSSGNMPRVVGLDAVSDILVPGLAIAAGALTAMVAIVASAAFAIASRRQLRSVGLLATAGADPATVRAALVLQGAIPGLIAALLALALGLTGAWAVGSSGLLESSTHLRDASPVISVGGVAMSVVLGVLAGTLAAWWPARSASRIPVLSALAGRRPVGPASTNVPLTGLAAVVAGGVGLALLVRRVATHEGSADPLVTITPLLMLGTVLAMLFGLVALAPTLVAVVGRLSTHVSGTTRIALRGIARPRTQSSAAVAAVAICLAVPVGVLTTKASIDDENARDRRVWQDQPSSTAGADSAGFSGDAGEPVEPMEASTSLVGEVPMIIVRGDLTSPAVDGLVEQVVAQAGPVIRVPFVAYGDGHGAWQIVAALDPDAAASKLPAWAADHLRTGGAIALGGAPGTITLDDDLDQLSLQAMAAPDGTPQHLSQWIEADYLVPSEVLTRIGVGRPPLNLLLLPQEEVDADAISALERSSWDRNGMHLQAQPSLADLRESLRTGQPVGPAAERASWPTGAAEVWFEVERRISIDGESMESDPSTTTTYQDQGEVTFRRWLLVVAVVAGALSLLVLTITLALRSVDSVDDHRAAIAAGAAPGRISRQRSLEGVVLATLGALLALPLGWLPVTAVRFGQVRRRLPDQGSLDAITSRLHVPGWEILPILALPVLVVGVLWLLGPWLRDAVRRGPVDQVLPRY